MQEYNSIIGNLFNSIKRSIFKRIVDRHQGDRYFKSFRTWEHFVSIFLGQILKNCNSLRDIEDFLLSNQNQWYHLGIKHKITRSTISYANNNRSWEIFFDIFKYLLAKTKNLTEPINPVKIIDSTPIFLNLNLCTWAERTLRIKGMKMHTVFDLNSKNPVHFTFTGAKTNDIEEGKKVEIKKGTTYVFDRGYINFNWWNEIIEKGAYFVTRPTSRIAFIEQSEKIKENEIISYQYVKLKNKFTKYGTNSVKNKCADKKLKLVFIDRKNDKPMVLITNKIDASNEEISQLYQKRWQIELFFKWIKQNLQIKSFLGRSENAVKLQICVALIAYLLIQQAEELKEYMSEVCKYFTESKFIKLINNNIFQTLKPRKYGRNSRDNPWQLTFDFCT